MSIKIGVVGLGIGKHHAASLSKIEGAEVVALADLNDTLLQEQAIKYGARTYGDWNAMLAGEAGLDAVILATPAIVRREPIEAICERGLALFCEKPPAVSLEEAWRISDIIEASGVLNTVGFMYRWSPLATRMRELIAGRECLFARGVVAWPVLGWVMGGGAPKSLFSKAACGGPLIEQAIHFQDVLRYITNDEPVSVQAIAELGNIYPQSGRDCEETTAYLLRHQSGMLSTHIHNWSHQGGLLQLQVVGETFDITWHMENDAMRMFGKVDGQDIEEATDASPYYEEMVGFVDAVTKCDQSKLRSPYADACRSMAVVAAATQAVETGETKFVAAP